MIGPLERELRAKRDAGRKLLVPYITGGFEGWEDRQFEHRASIGGTVATVVTIECVKSSTNQKAYAILASEFADQPNRGRRWSDRAFWSRYFRPLGVLPYILI